MCMHAAHQKKTSSPHHFWKKICLCLASWPNAGLGRGVKQCDYLSLNPYCQYWLYIVLVLVGTYNL